MKIQKIQYTRFYWGLEKVYRMFTQHFYPSAIIYHRLYCLTHKDIRLLKGQMIGLREYLRDKKISKILIFSKEKIKIFDMRYYNENYENKQHDSGSQLVFPEVFATKLYNVNIYGGFNIVSDKKFIIEPFYNSRTRKRWSYLNKLLKTNKGTLGVIRYKESKTNIDKAISLCGSADGNYYHFLTELLPKIAIIEQKKMFLEYPIVLDSVVESMPSLLEALGKINLSGRKIIFAEKGASYKVDELACISEVALSPMNLKVGQCVIDEDLIFSKKSINCMKEMLVTQFVKKGDDKIYLARFESGRQRLSNDEQIAKLCKKRGVKVVFPEKLSFNEQVALFMGAEYIIGCAGAAMTNALFSRPGTKVYVIMPKEHDNNHWYSFLKNMGLNPILVDANIVLRATYKAGDIYTVNERDIFQVLEEIDSRKE